MEFFLSFMTAAVAMFAFLLFLYYAVSMVSSGHRHSSRKGREAPEAAGAWPLMGHLHLLGGRELPYKILGAMADKYGPVFTIRLGVHRALVVSNSEMAKECLTTNDKAFSNRPKSIAVEHMCYNYAMFGFSPYGPYWREMRKITTLELLSNHRLATFNHIRESEVKASIKNIYEQWVKKNNSTSASNYKVPVVVEMKRWFGDINLNLIFRIVAGKRFVEGDTAEGERCRKSLRDFFDLMGVITVADAVPFLRWLDLGGYEKAMKKTAKELDGVLQGWLEEHKHKRISGEAKAEQDFMDVMLSVLDGGVTQEGPKFDADTINKATCLSLTLGATDTTTVTLTWALALLLNNQQVLKRAQDELQTHVGSHRQVKESDMKELPYLQAIVKETLRLYPPAQLSPPREAVEDCFVGGYHVPTGTRLFLNLWKIHRDPQVWADPLEFQPERFLTINKDVDVRGQHFELIPFGSGRRACPGISFALQVVQFTLASLLHSFEFATPSDEVVDMTESNGFTNIKATPLQVLLIPRLPAEFYG
ncbi:Cytochrome P450 82A3 [Camellia lanceoleosa]|uniref:Cytochrome P450 82A3 n=1 Tax=Camellia lanceoleosa TaxID=1840588 RepID=A0ACC0GVC8_9ERIC|nr:Cytochrome P450 82A3 [Camellia lanceoleosa]